MAFGSVSGLPYRLMLCAALLGFVPVVAGAQAAEPPPPGVKGNPAAKKAPDAKLGPEDVVLLREKEQARLAELAKAKLAKEKLERDKLERDKLEQDKLEKDKAAAKAAAPVPPPTPLTAGARRIAIGAMSADSQIAVRGSLIVTATDKSADGKTPGGVRVLRGSASSLEVLFFAPSPADFVASGVALVEDSIFYVLNHKDDKRSLVVNLGLDGSYRWSRELAGPARSLPLIQTGERGVALRIWVLVAGSEHLQLAQMDPTTGAPDKAIDVPACGADGKGRLYYLRQDEPSSLAVWCQSGAGNGAKGNLVYIPSEQPSLQQLAPTPFANAPTLALAEFAPPSSTLPVEHAWLFADWTSEGEGGAAVGASLRCDFRKRRSCLPLSGHAWGRDDSPGSLGFSLRDEVTQAWTRLSLSAAGELIYRGAAATPVRFALDLQHVTTASLSDFDADDTWEVVAAGAGELAVFEPGLDDEVLDRFPRGDLALSGVTPAWLQSSLRDGFAPDNEIAALTDSAARNGAGGGFRLEALEHWPAPDQHVAASNRTLFGFGRLEPVIFQPSLDNSQPAVVPGPVGEHVLASTAGGRWYLADWNSVKVAERQADESIQLSKVWPPTGRDVVVRGFDAGGDSIAIVTAAEALWCGLSVGESTLKCETVVSDDLPGPVALSPDGRSFWLGMGDGSVRRWQRASASSVRSEVRGIAARKGELHLLRAFESSLYVGREQVVERFSVGSLPEKQKSYPFHADAIERCDASRAYALNDGQLVYAHGDSDFELVQDQPAFIGAIACDAQGSLIGVSSRFGAFRLPSPPGWPWQTLLWCLAIVALPALGLLFFGPLREQQRRFSGKPRSSSGSAPVGVLDHMVSHILDADSPKENFASGTRGQQALVGALRDFLDNEATVPPLTLGVYGAWGSGKSSVMHMLDGELQKTGRYVTVWFNAWRHHQESQLGPALLQNIVREFRRQAGPRVRFYSLLSALRDSRRTFYWGAAALTLALPSVAGYLVSHDKRALVGLLGSIVPFWKSVFTPVVRLFSMEPAEAANKSFSERIDFLQEFSEEFERVVGSLPKNHYLAIFVDDLDRCPPNRVANVLEALNRLMESRLCFVVLGMDPDTVRRCVEMRYAKLIASLAKDGSDRAANFGEQFLEKLVGMAVSVPPVPADELEEKQVEEEHAREVEVPRRQQLRTLLSDLGAGVLSRIDQVLVTAVLVAAVATAFLCWRQDPQRVEGWVQTAVTLDQEADGESPAPAPSSGAGASKEGQEGLPHVADEPAAAKVPELTAKADPPAVSPKQSPPVSPAPGKTAAAAPAASAGVLQVARVLGSPPATAEAAEVARITQPHAEPLSREYEAAENFNQVLMLGVGVVAALGALLLGAMLWREIQIDRRAPPRKDSTAFAVALKKSSIRFKNPRQRVRYRNLARLTYHLVAEACQDRVNWEDTFFELLSAHVLGGEFIPSSEHAWVAAELDRWLERVARPAGPPAAARASVVPLSSGTQPAASRQSLSSAPPPTGTDALDVVASETRD